MPEYPLKIVVKGPLNVETGVTVGVSTRTIPKVPDPEGSNVRVSVNKPDIAVEVVM